ncbi:type IV secretion system protein [Hydrogenophaga sp.]|uniref:type IV secretion system protein n=1 Tax=Hydrogenophaga sp. TaxID=1904254 RepID=UPI00262333EE|nr:type IV secretion system protein [Hydrogenophaga sp.]MCW5654239.1 type IV secretion system protein [Hydrogenophaga sp.]
MPPTENADGPSPESLYYTAAARWDADFVRSSKVARNRAYLFAAVSWLLTIAASLAMFVVFSREKIEVVTIAYNDATQTVRHVRYDVDDAQRLTGMDAVRKFHINQWILAAETWSDADVRQRADTVRMFAGPTLEPRLSALFGGSLQDRSMGPRLRRAVKVHSISFLKDGVAHVQFQSEESVDGRVTGTYEWAAIVEFRFTLKPTPAGELLNPFGFQVTNYRRDASNVRTP